MDVRLVWGERGVSRTHAFAIAFAHTRTHVSACVLHMYDTDSMALELMMMMTKALFLSLRVVALLNETGFACSLACFHLHLVREIHVRRGFSDGCDLCAWLMSTVAWYRGGGSKYSLADVGTRW